MCTRVQAVSAQSGWNMLAMWKEGVLMARAKAVGKAFALSGHWFVAPPRGTTLEKVKSNWQISFSGIVSDCTEIEMFVCVQSVDYLSCVLLLVRQQILRSYNISLHVCRCYWLLLYSWCLAFKLFHCPIIRTVQSPKTLAYIYLTLMPSSTGFASWICTSTDWTLSAKLCALWR